MRVFLIVFIFSFCVTSIGRAAQDYLPPLPHQAALVKGLQAIDQGQWGVGESLIAGASGTMTGRIFYWLKYSHPSGDKGAEWIRISRFIKSHKNWPGLRDMQENAEEVMPANLASTEVIRWFSQFSPVSKQGRIRYLSALAAQKKTALLKQELIGFWTGTLFGEEEQRIFLRKYGSYLTSNHHKKRLQFLMARGYYDTAIGLSGVLGADYRTLAVAVKGTAKSAKNVSALIAAVPASFKNDPALHYERMKWRRKKNLNDGLIELLNKAPSMTKQMMAYNWWKERHIMIRRLIEERRYQEAYHLASHHKQKEGLGLSEAEFMAGWLALRFVNKPHQAYQHFQNLYHGVRTPISKARGAYWAGRAAVKLGRPEKSREWYKAASYWHTTFYGQRAYEELQKVKQREGADSLSIQRPAPVIVSDDVWGRWSRDDRVTAMRILYQAGLEDRALQFLMKMGSEEGMSPSDFMSLAKVTRLMAFPYGEVKIAKKAAYNKIILVASDRSVFGYPVLKVENREDKIGVSHIHAIIRQESEFNTKAKSHAGAQGYMQLMPATAKQTARKLNLKHRTSWLTLRPEHNIRLGSSYLDGLMEQFDGNLIMAAGGYNAGPHRVTQWVKEFGDPRQGNVDLIDWIELMPFSETRNYVQRVSEAEQLYAAHFKVLSR